MNLTPYFNFTFANSRKVQRTDEDDVINSRLKDSEGKDYFLNEVQAHSLRDGLDGVYAFLNKLKTHHSKLILPISRHDDSSNFFFKKKGSHFYFSRLIIDHESFSVKINSLQSLWDGLDMFFESRFDNIHFTSGPIHWDIHAGNLGQTSDGKIVLLDLDLVQEGAYAQDIITAAAIYVYWNHPEDVLT